MELTRVDIEDDGLLPLIARLRDEPLTLLVKSGRVGGPEGERGSLPITERDAEAALEAALDEEAEWERDPDLGVELLISGAEGVDQGLLIPRFLYRRADRIYEYAAAMPGAKARLGELVR